MTICLIDLAGAHGQLGRMRLLIAVYLMTNVPRGTVRARKVNAVERENPHWIDLGPALLGGYEHRL